MDLDFDVPFDLPVKPMLAKLTRTIPDGDNWLFEPKWDGFRCIVYRDGDRLELVSRKLRPLARYFPELLEPLAQALPAECIVDGEIVVADRDGNGLDFDALLQRIHPAQSRVDRLAAETPASFVAFDLLALGTRSLLGETMQARRGVLIEELQPGATVRLTPATTSREVAGEWFGRFEGAGLDGIIAKPLDGVYEQGKRSLVKVKHQRTALCAVPGYRIHKDGNGIGSLLLGLYNADAEMRSVGVAAAFSVARRAELLAELEPRSRHGLVDHPWQDWARGQTEQHEPAGSAAAVPAKSQPAKGAQGGSRWSVGKDMSFVPIGMGLVAEVTFGQLEGGRFRHGVKFIRWRPDRTPRDCRFDQLDVATPVNFDELWR